jgi:hypothetical protein
MTEKRCLWDGQSRIVVETFCSLDTGEVTKLRLLDAIAITTFDRSLLLGH